MSQVTDFKCPSCGGYVEFDPARQQFRCRFCGQVLSESDLSETQEQQIPRAEENSMDQQTGGYRGYHCLSCGAQIVTGDTTAATRCYYCHNPVVLSDRLDGEFRPDGVIPFTLDKDGAKEAFAKFIRRKKFVDRDFYSQAQLEDFSGVYYPYWMGDIEGEAAFTGEGTRVSVMRGPSHTVTTTKHYRVQREGRVRFANMFRKALSSADRTLSEGIHPYRYDEMKAYAPGYLSGFMAEMRDVDEAPVREEMVAEARGQVDGIMRQGNDYHSLTGRTTFRADKTDLRYVLMPAWVLTYKGSRDGAPYYYMMNGQTGEVCGKLPVKKSKLLSWCLGVGLGLFALLCAGGAWIW